MSVGKFLKFTITNVAAAIFALGPTANALNVKLTKSINLRQSNGKVLKVLRTLPAGTVVTLPDDIMQGRTNITDQDLLNALSRVGSLQRYSSGGKVKRDYFLSIKTPDGESGQIAIRYLAKKGGLELVEEAPLVEDKPPEPRVFPEPQIKPNPPTTGADVSAPTRTAPDSPVTTTTPGSSEDLIQSLGMQCSERNGHWDKLRTDLTKALNRVNETVEERVSEGGSMGQSGSIVEDSINRSCGSGFFNKIVSTAQENRIPPGILIGKIWAESSGNCNTGEGDKDTSFGLMQLNLPTLDLKLVEKYCPHIPPGQINRTSEAVKNCLRDKDVNLNMGIEVLVRKYKRVNDQTPEQVYNDMGSSRGSLMKLESLTQKERDYWRKAIAAYNGGEGWIFKAWRDIKEFQKNNPNFRVNGQRLDPDNWEHRRVFMFRDVMKENGVRTRADGANGASIARAHENTFSNLRHVEQIMGRETNEQGIAYNIDQWIHDPRRYN
jgi:hypothetical protein